MPRPSTPIGTWGEINTKILSPGKARARCYYRDIDGKSRLVEKHAPTKAKAKQKLLETLKERTFITSTSLVDNKTTISDLSHKWLDRKNETKQIKTQTFNAYEYTVNKFIIPQVGNLKITETTTGILENFLQTIISETERKRARIILIGTFKLAQQFDLVNRNVAEATSPIIPKNKPNPTALTPEQIKLIRNKVREWETNPLHQAKRSKDLSKLIDVLIGTGMRPNEVLALQWPDVDLDSEIPTLEVKATLIRDKKGKPALQEEPKSSSGIRKLILPDIAVKALREQYETDLNRISPFVFPNVNGGPKALGNIRRNLRLAINGVPGLEGFTLKQIRTTVTTAVEQEYGLKAASVQAGHSSTKITEEYYVEKSIESQNISKAINKLVQ